MLLAAYLQSSGFLHEIIHIIYFISLYSSTVFAHTDHALGEGHLHTLYHLFFSTIPIVVLFNAYAWFRGKK